MFVFKVRGREEVGLFEGTEGLTARKMDGKNNGLKTKTIEQRAVGELWGLRKTKV